MKLKLKDAIKVEAELIPYEAVSLPPGPLLVFAPHPDDETLGMGGTIALAVAAGKEVYLVLATNGEQGGDHHVRQKEVVMAAQILGINNIYYLNIPDRGIFSTPFPEDRIVEIMSTIQPATLFLPSFQEIHPDHRALTWKLLLFFQQHNYKFQLWLYEINRHGEINHLVDISTVLETKEVAISCYRSQIEQLDYKSYALCMNYTRAITLDKGSNYAEGFWVYDWKGDYSDLLISYEKHMMNYLPVVFENAAVKGITGSKKESLNKRSLLGKFFSFYK